MNSVQDQLLKLAINLGVSPRMLQYRLDNHIPSETDRQIAHLLQLVGPKKTEQIIRRCGEEAR